MTDFESARQKIEERIGYRFRDPSLLKQAFTRTSFCNEEKMRGEDAPQSNEVLEFFGDGILSAAIITFMIRDFSTRCAYGIRTALAEGDFSNIKARLSDKKNLSKSMRELGLQQYLILGAGDAKTGTAEEPSVMEDLFESIIGAVYIDSGCDMSAVLPIVARMLDVGEYLTKKGDAVKSPKNALQEYCADKKHRLPPPVYTVVAESGPEHRRMYEYLCTIGGKAYGRGAGKNRIAAESAAAEETLRLLTEDEPPAKAAIGGAGECATGRLAGYAAARHLPPPVYEDLGEAGDDAYERYYRALCRFGGYRAEGVGRSKKEAKSAAAQKVLALLSEK